VLRNLEFVPILNLQYGTLRHLEVSLHLIRKSDWKMCRYQVSIVETPILSNIVDPISKCCIFMHYQPPIYNGNCQKKKVYTMVIIHFPYIVQPYHCTINEQIQTQKLQNVKCLKQKVFVFILYTYYAVFQIYLKSIFASYQFKFSGTN